MSIQSVHCPYTKDKTLYIVANSLIINTVIQVLKTLLFISILIITIACDEETLVAPEIENDLLSDHDRDSIAWKEDVLDLIRTFPDHVHGKIDTLTYNGDSLVNFVWIAWDSTDLALSGEMLHSFFSTIEPFATYKHLFNTYIVYHSLSDEFENPIFQYNGYIDPNPTIEKMRKDSVNNFFLMASAVNLGHADHELRIVQFRRGQVSVMGHELGHLFGLGDEYIDRPPLLAVDLIDVFIEQKYPNIDTTADESKVVWSHFIGLEGYESIGVFEGAFHCETGFYRPTMSSLMNESVSGEFNAPCREGIVKMVYEIVGLEYSFDEFLKNDRK